MDAKDTIEVSRQALFEFFQTCKPVAGGTMEKTIIALVGYCNEKLGDHECRRYLGHHLQDNFWHSHITPTLQLRWKIEEKSIIKLLNDDPIVVDMNN